MLMNSMQGDCAPWQRPCTLTGGCGSACCMCGISGRCAQARLGLEASRPVPCTVEGLRDGVRHTMDAAFAQCMSEADIHPVLRVPHRTHFTL